MTQHDHFSNATKSAEPDAGFRISKNEVAAYVIDILTGKLAPRQYKKSKEWYLDLGLFAAVSPDFANYNTEELARFALEALEPYVVDDELYPLPEEAEPRTKITNPEILEQARQREEARVSQPEAKPNPQTDDITPEISNGPEEIAPQLDPSAVDLRAIDIPPALKPLAEQKRWVIWKWEPTKRGKPTKVPYKGLTPSKKASTTQSTTWCDLKTAMLAYTEGKADGIGYVLTDGDISGIDIDDCRNATTGELHAWAAEQITRSNSYAEVTPSNEGVRIIGLSNGGIALNNPYAVPNTNVSGELYRRPSGRYITITGKQIGAATELVNIDAQIDMLMPLLVTEASEDQVATENKWGSFTLLPYNGSGPIPIAPEFADLDPNKGLADGLEEWLEQQEQWLKQHKKQLLTALELLNANGIYLKNYNPGNHSRTCPKCLASRKRENKKKRCLSVKIDDKGATWKCHNCGWSGPEKGQQRITPATILREQISDEVPSTQSNTQQKPTPAPEIPDHDDKNFVAIYDYPGFQKVRFPKGHEPRFLIRHRDPSSSRAGKGWDWGAGGADTSVLYRRDEIDEAIANGYEIVLVEGEKDADRLWSIGIPATCSALGASKPNDDPKWTIEHSKQLADANIVVLGDHDAPGCAHQDATCRTSLGIAKRVRILKLADHWPEIKEGGDISDWLDAGHTREELDALIEQAPDYASQLPNDGTALGYSWHLIWHGETDPTDARKALVQDLLPETGVALIPGQWGTYKTFVADDLCAAVMTATTFANKQVMRQGGVLFLACEGHNEVDIRLTAAFQKHGGTGKAPFAWVKGCPRLLDKNAGKILAAMVKHAATKMMHDFGLPVVMVIIDTAGKAAGLSKQGELNDDAVAKIIMSALAEASILTGALFVGVAHFGKNVETGTKGSTGFEDDADVVLALLGERGINGTVPNPLLCARKRKSGPNGEEFPFQTEEAEVDSEKTLTIRWTDAATAKPAPKKKDDPWAAKSLRHLRQTLMNMLADCGSEQRPYPDGPIVRAVDIEIVRAEFYKTYPAIGDETTKKEARRKAFNRAISDADHKHLISTRDIGPTTFIWLANPTDPATAPAPPPKPKTPQKRPARSKSDDFPYDGPVVEVPDQGPDPLDEHGAPID